MATRLQALGKLEVEADAVRACWHCGSPLAPGADLRAALDGAERAFCCRGCLAVANTIAAAGLGRYYAVRAMPGRAPAASAVAPVAWDRAARAAGLVVDLGDDRREASLLLDGLECGACVWLVESWLARTPGVVEARVNAATRRAHVAWRPSVTSLDGVVASLDAIGYGAHPYDPRRREDGARRERRDRLLRTGVALLGMMQVMMFALPGYLGIDAPSPAEQRLIDWASLVITIPVLAWAGAPFFAGAWRDLARHRLGMDVPIALGLGAAFGASAWSTLGAGGPVYYDSVTMFVALVSVARYVELVLRQRAGEAIERAARALPPTAERLRGTDGAATVAGGANALAPGDRVLVRAGAALPADGVVVEGRGDIEEAMLTGESAPRPRAAGDRVLAGSIALSGPLVVRVTAAGAATELAAILRMVDRAAATRPRAARLADRAAGVFVVMLVLLAAATAAAWLAIDPARALPITFALLVVSCPCALSLATPAAYAAAAAALARRRLVFARPDALETLASVTHLVFDKTGTLTAGAHSLTDLRCFGALDRDAVLARAAALEASSGHALARAFADIAPAGTRLRAETVREVAGQGVEGRVDGRRMRIGRVAFVADLAGAPPAALSAWEEGVGERASVVALGDEHGFLAAFALGDSLRREARDTVRRLADLGVETSVLSGDRMAAVAGYARQAGIASARGELTPEDKRAAIEALQAQGAVVAMAGDGVNDAPALARADVSLSLAGATPIAQWTADAVALGDDLGAFADAIAHARRTRRVVRQNLGWALAYNMVAIPAAALGFVTPLVAAIGMSVSSLVVVVNASRLTRHAGGQPPEAPAAPLGRADVAPRAA